MIRLVYALAALLAAMLAKYPPPSPPYLGPPAKSSAGTNKPIRRIVIHSTVSPSSAGWARKIAAYFRSDSAGGSAHYVVDAAEVVQSAYDSVIAWHAPPNTGSIGVELCDHPSARDARRWRDADHRSMFQLAARLVAELCLAYEIPAAWLSPAKLRDGGRGVTSHANVSAAFGQSSHWDPGKWPRRRFMRAVRREIRKIEQEAKA